MITIRKNWIASDYCYFLSRFIPKSTYLYISIIIWKIGWLFILIFWKNPNYGRNIKMYESSNLLFQFSCFWLIRMYWNCWLISLRINKQKVFHMRWTHVDTILSKLANVQIIYWKLPNVMGICSKLANNMIFSSKFFKCDWYSLN